ncbi:hypothetical protein [Helicobacter bilis]|uniref:hypothetical protein n=1 Tax=Helicobacter bilis TaxID=37372 RepID=UPI0012DB1D1C|nr:hypothetical protein [Helicobacter bilis]
MLDISVLSYSLLTSPPLTTSPLESITTSMPPAFIITESPLVVIEVSKLFNISVLIRRAVSLVSKDRRWEARELVGYFY